ncbi:hypothetical protein IKQ26_04485 [bacterium]|nr:hypothetical protein [bacterium]
MKNKNLILLLLSLILFAYAFVIGVMPMIINDGLKKKNIIPEIERLTQLKVDYSGAKVAVSPLFNVTLTINNATAEKKDVDQKVASATAIRMELGIASLFTKNYNIKSLLIKDAKYHEVLDNGNPEIVNFLDKYSLLSVAGADYNIKTCPITINYLLKTSYNVQTGEYTEKNFDSLDIDAEAFEKFIIEASQGKIKTSH